MFIQVYSTLAYISNRFIKRGLLLKTTITKDKQVKAQITLTKKVIA